MHAALEGRVRLASRRFDEDTQLNATILYASTRDRPLGGAVVLHFFLRCLRRDLYGDQYSTAQLQVAWRLL